MKSLILYNVKNISAVILAAGSGKRIGTPKLKLKIGEDYFVNLIVSKIKSAGIENILCIIREADKDWFKKFALPVSYAVNSNPESGMVHSVLLGINHFKDSSAIVIFPVDHPTVKPETLASLIKVFSENTSSIIKPRFKNQSGHPIIIPKCLFHYALKSNGNDNFKTIIQSSNLPVIYVNIEDEGILKNINLKSDLENIS